MTCERREFHRSKFKEKRDPSKNLALILKVVKNINSLNNRIGTVSSPVLIVSDMLGNLLYPCFLEKKKKKKVKFCN